MQFGSGVAIGPGSFHDSADRGNPDRKMLPVSVRYRVHIHLLKSQEVGCKTFLDFVVFYFLELYRID